ncbi:hypothetical protein [Ornithinimicrobium murale]|uniref:hypothetical protein n=1 Tax=Ornithinimicrobium murale TaxID=1050153 RepID=UPI000E0D3128|nr:hypothetical protein [Ornithinimicrobium murale]
MKKFLATSAITVVLLAPLDAATAYPVKYSWHGNDRSWNNSDGNTLYVCDGEDDSNWAEGQRWTASNTRHVITDNNVAGCPSVTVSIDMYKHRVVERRMINDSVGPMQYLW